ncbi:hypothetical protein, unknown function [Leishmania infantum JPCM5]|uniref:Tetratricopeptide_repeat_-_putative n=3 Tax=Leishmania donovani species complex TaxID=38574 RepID=A0A6L0XUG3_LEIIN|nr:hypothetical protein, unknown function [Leishmania infantum JPCM5]XP_003862372.1 hypothetical protein, unknown function [Leishmania donovani]CAC9505205.1 Tetratricopeptide_repeat_-_putative [Leishmania infantum]AYU80429.1 Tetratricopeptide repeat, putative [Leishmania donovani]TPP54396.1 Tetratricopeptide repeat family protein [Leishmania donovani]CAM69494.1 hypothetical protein, unknown function [Leishmania infantum JPCM5]CBZ35678.1 hypothetical protein, unknown function [Leishmania donov|eukprot:XP_001470299.1 hypothetical protein, unknown function [Leishmania infantum JPCM5]
MAGKTVRALHLEGNKLFEAGRFNEAARAFRDAVDRFQADQLSTKSAVEEFVKVAGNLCVCHHATGNWHECVKAARELLAIYPIIPKAYAAIGMCIVNRLLEQEAEQRAMDAQNSPRMPPRSSEEVRRDVRRYLVKLGGVVCTADDAHKYLCRAILLSEGALQVPLGPYVETAVRWVSEQLLSAGLSLEREYGDGVMGELSVLEESVCDPPPLLDVAPVPIERHSIRVLDAVDMSGTAPEGCRVEELPEAEAEGILQAIQEGQRAARGEAADSPSPAAESDAAGTSTATDHSGSIFSNASSRGSHAAVAPPLDYFLSQQRTRVRVCHAERGGIPRGLTLVRASKPFAIGQHILPAAPADLTAVAGAGVPSPAVPLALPSSTQGELALLHADPATSSSAEGAFALHALSSSLAQTGSGDALSMRDLPTSESPPLLMCSACGRELNPVQFADASPTGCSTCNGVVYCSAACAVAYQDRHDRHECALRLALQRRVEALTAVPPSTDSETPLPVGDVLPGGGWNALDLHRRILPLCIAVYSGLRSRAPGAAEVQAQVERGVQRRLRHALPAEVAETLAEWAKTLESALAASASTTGTASSALPPQDEEEGKQRGDQQCDHLTDAATPTSCAAAGEKPSLAAHLLAIFFIVRLLAVNHAESRCNAFYVERLLLRHSCEPNCIWSDTLRGILTARFICKGEEMTMAVDDCFPQHWPWQVRQKWFVYHHGVPCQCARCLREGADLHYSRGMLANAVVEQLLTADVMGHPCPTPAHKHPTHLFHLPVQRLVEQSKSPRQRNVPALLCRLDEMRAEVGKYVLPSHYLLEDIRRAMLNVAEAEGHLTGCTAEAQRSLLFWESQWAGAIPAKAQRLRLLPSVFECGRRRKPHPHQQLRRRRNTRQPATSASALAEQLQGTSPERRESVSPPSPVPTPMDVSHGSSGTAFSAVHAFRPAGEGYGDHEANKAEVASAVATAAAPPRTPVPAPLIATKDFSGRNIIDIFYGSYQTWYM